MPIPTQTDTPDFLEILRVLAAHDVRFIVVGGMSAVMQGAPYLTYDLDAVHDRSDENIQRLIPALANLRAVYRHKPEVGPQARALAGQGHQLLATRCGPLDLLGEITGGRAYGDLLPRACPVEVEPGLTIQALGIEALIEEKESLGRDKDRLLLPWLRRMRVRR